MQPTRLHGARGRWRAWRARLRGGGAAALRALATAPLLAPGWRRWIARMGCDPRARFAEALTIGGLFSEAAYREANPDCGADALAHYLQTGVHEGRALMPPSRAAEIIATAMASPLHAEMMAEGAAPAPAAPVPARPIGVYVNSFSNFFLREIGDLVVRALALAGAQAELRDERQGDIGGLSHLLFIAPHEFFTLGRGTKWERRALARAAVLSTEQLQSPWFGASLPFLAEARLVIDINTQTATVLRQAGLAAHCIQPGHDAGFAPFGPAPDMRGHPVFAGFGPAIQHFDPAEDRLAARPFEVVFLGQHTARRGRFFAENAAFFAARESFLYCAHGGTPLVSGRNPMADARVTAALLGRARAALNIHRDDVPFFEWMRVLQAFWQRAVVVTEPCFPHPIFTAGEHFIAAPLSEIPARLDWLARSAEGLAEGERMREAALGTLVRHMPLAETGRKLLCVLAGAPA